MIQRIIKQNTKLIGPPPQRSVTASNLCSASTAGSVPRTSQGSSATGGAGAGGDGAGAGAGGAGD